jgi:hypothetical protein
LAALLTGMLGSAAMVWSASNAAFSGSTVNPNNSWTAGTVSLTDNDGGAAMFNAAGLTPATTLTRCITVTYGGSVTAPVRIYGAVPGGTGLAGYLNLTIEVGTGSTDAVCSGFSLGAGGTIFSGTLAAFAAAHTDYTTGLVTGWSPTGAAQSQSFRFQATVADDNNAKGLSCTMPFTWEAQA